MTTAPPVSVLVVNRNGRDRPGECLSSLEAQEYPGSRPIVEIVDIERGAAERCNAAVTAASTDWVAFLHSDTRVDPRWLIELASTARRREASAVASKILNWSGDRVEFAGAAVSLTGHVSSRQIDECREVELLFASAASVLLNRGAFLEAGGFDSDFLGEYDDVDLGWRLHLLGHRTVLAPAAVTYRREIETRWRSADRQRLRLTERNALAMLYKNCEAGTLERVLPAAIAISLLRGFAASGIDRLQLHFGATNPPSVAIDQRLAAHLIALEDFARSLAGLEIKRKEIQTSRRRSDTDLFPLFADLIPSDLPGEYAQVARTLVEAFSLDETVQSTATAILPPPMARPRSRTQDRISRSTDVPKVSVIVLTVLGTEHLRDCLTSLRTQNYPGDRCEVIVVDNGSPDPVTAAIETFYPGVRIVRNTSNLGFAKGNNVGAEQANGEFLFFLNDDTRVHPDCIRELIATVRRRDAAAAGACLLDWSGRTIDFSGGAVNFEGKGLQIGHGTDSTQVPHGDRPLLFACGGALLIDRRVFAESGGWDDDAFAYYEDVELGWRLNVLGHQVWLSPRAIVYHKQHGTAGRWADAPRTRLFQRNSLRILYSLLELRTLARVLPAALVLAADRALLMTNLSRAHEIPRQPSSFGKMERLVESVKTALRERGVGRRTPLSTMLKTVAREAPGIIGSIATAGDARARYAIGLHDCSRAADRRVETIPLPAAAILSGVFGFLVDLPALASRRDDIQRRRQVTDAELLRSFGNEWTTPSTSVHPREHEAMQRGLIELLGIGDR